MGTADERGRSLLPAELARERGSVLHRALRTLPAELLVPLRRGLRRQADTLVPGRLYSGDGGGGCAVGVMLRELGDCERGGAARSSRHVVPRLTIREEWPALARRHPRLAHLELAFDNTCAALRRRAPELSEGEVAGRVGLWMAAEVDAELNLRRLETAGGAAGDDHGHAAGSGADADRHGALFADTVARLRELRPWLSEAAASRAVEDWVGGGGVQPEPVFVPPEWVEEQRLHERRLAEAPDEPPRRPGTPAR